MNEIVTAERSLKVICRSFVASILLTGVLLADFNPELRFSPIPSAQEPSESPQELEKLYSHYISGSFAEVVPEIARQFKPAPFGVFYSGAYPPEWEKSPWLGGRASVLGAAWHYHTDYVERKESYGKNIETLMRIIEDRTIGLGRQMALQAVRVRLDFGGGDPSMPPDHEFAARLGKIVREPTEDHDLKYWLIPILFEHGDPNEWLDTAIQFSGLKGDAVSKGESFRHLAPSLHTGKLTAANRAKYLNYAFGLLEEMDDGRSGIGYFLADDLSQVIVIPLGRTDTDLFRPAVNRPEFHDGMNATPAFFQFPVDNALSWWRQHRHEYAHGARPGIETKGGDRPQKIRRARTNNPHGMESRHLRISNRWNALLILLFVIGAAIIAYQMRART